MDSDLKDRIKKIRIKNKLTQAEFAKRLGTVQNTITGYETGRRNPSGSALTLMCEKFNVNEKWLRTGRGEMFAQIPEEDEYFKAATQISKNNDEIAMQAIIEYWKVDDASKETIRNYIRNLAKSIVEKQQVLFTPATMLDF